MTLSIRRRGSRGIEEDWLVTLGKNLNVKASSVQHYGSDITKHGRVNREALEWDGEESVRWEGIGWHWSAALQVSRNITLETMCVT